MPPRSVYLLLAVTAAASCLPGIPDPGADSNAPAGQGVGSCGTGTWQPGWLEIHHIDAGEAIATLIVSPVGRSMLVDAGEAAWNQSTGAETVGAYVRSVLGCAELDYVVLSHFHVDHVGFPGHGGIWHLANAHGFVVHKLLHRDLYRYPGAGGSTVAAFRDYLQSSEGQRLAPEIAAIGTGQVHLGGGVAFGFVVVDGNGVLPDGDQSLEPAPPSENDYSLAFLLRMGRLDYFSGGDLSGQTYVSFEGGYSYHDVETRAAPQVKDVDVYRVSHHGSAFSSNPIFLAELDPEVSILQVADGNSNGHPAQETVDRLLATSTLYLTRRGDPTRNLGSAKALGHVVLRSATGVDYAVNDETFVAADPRRIDGDGDGYFEEADPDDGSSAVVPDANGGCDSSAKACE